MRIRRASLEDLPGIMLTEDRCFADGRFSSQVVQSLILRNHAFVLVAIVDDAIVGAAACLFSRAQGIGRIASVAVLPEHRARGIGSKLLGACERELCEMGVTRFGLEVSVENIVAVRMYESNGYQVKSLIVDYYGNGMDALYMEKDVTMSGRRTKVRLS